MPLTGELARIDDELRRACGGDCWHGPPLREVLKGVTAERAVAKHPQLALSIWLRRKEAAAARFYTGLGFLPSGGAPDGTHVMDLRPAPDREHLPVGQARWRT
jgi:hypothetical protein